MELFWVRIYLLVFPSKKGNLSLVDKRNVVDWYKKELEHGPT